MGKFFGTDGVRGVANRELTCELAIKLGRAAAKVLTGNCGHSAKILIGKDTRISSDMLENALLAGIASVGAKGISLGVVPTPAVSYLVKKYNADAGIMISASHNSFEFNGIKFFNKDGYKLTDEIEDSIEKLVEGKGELSLPIGEKLGKILKCESAIDDYINYLCETFEGNIENLKIAVDCANGSASATAGKIFSKINSNATILFDDPDGININENCGSTHLEKLSEYVVKNKCDIGIAFDGDADRCLLIDNNGKIVDGDIILALCAKYLKDNGKLTNNTLVATVMSNMGLKEFCKKNDIDLSETKVGDRYVLERMLEKNYSIGGEQSGHVIFGDLSSTGDGQLTALQILNILSKTGKSISELSSQFVKYPQKQSEVKIELSQKGLLKNNEKIQEYIKNATAKLGSYGRILIRESGTEPKIRIMVECLDEKKLDSLIEEARIVVSENLK
ncbi:MAG: phosphoglucosamine mutase [Clostridia bacterium]|nr:phosphoglucosamine mutase [Clostridia bacterium]